MISTTQANVNFRHLFKGHSIWFGLQLIIENPPLT